MGGMFPRTPIGDAFTFTHYDHFQHAQADR